MGKHDGNQMSVLLVLHVVYIYIFGVDNGSGNMCDGGDGNGVTAVAK